uniref:Bacteriophage lambdhead decoration D domain protein n=1 Tax=Aeromonas hydrophila TaxID=644 RepID=A0A0K0VKS8_AERHY|nr:hypothetical protein [Aeromonas hydrophila]AKS10297.1 bacteriophage lambdhead decoration D domain protein [Aeromonas hydrophila]
MKTEFSILNISAGSEPLPTMTGHIAAGQGQLAARTPLMLGADANAGKLVKWDGTAGKAVAMTVGKVDAPPPKLLRYTSLAVLMQRQLLGLKP